jgi:hypothetical protein
LAPTPSSGEPQAANGFEHTPPKGFRIVNAEPDLIARIAFNRSTLRLAGFGLEPVARIKRA